MLEAPPRTIGIVMLSAVGDAVHVLPVVNALKRAWPECHITWMLKPGPATLVRGHPAVDDILVVETDRGLRGFVDLHRSLRTRPFDLVLALQVYVKAGIVTAMCRAPIKLGFDRRRARDLNWLVTNRRIPPHPRQHVQDQYFEFLRALGVPAEPVEWTLGPWDEERAWQRAFFADIGERVVAIVPTASNEERDWPAERWVELVDALQERHGLRAVIVGASTARDSALMRVLAERCRRAPVSQIGCGLRKVVAILEGAALVVSVDTGPLHIAVAVDTPVIALMANADPRRTGPYRKYQDLVVDAFRDPGDPDEVIWSRRSGRMARIRVADVLDRVARWEQRYR